MVLLLVSETATENGSAEDTFFLFYSDNMGTSKCSIQVFLSLKAKKTQRWEDRKNTNVKEWAGQMSIFSSLFLWPRLDFIAVTKSASDLGLQQLFTPIDISFNQSGSNAQEEGWA